jgi:hypothetical protein
MSGEKAVGRQVVGERRIHKGRNEDNKPAVVPGGSGTTNDGGTVTTSAVVNVLAYRVCGITAGRQARTGAAAGTVARKVVNPSVVRSTTAGTNKWKVTSSSVAVPYGQKATVVLVRNRPAGGGQQAQQPRV